MRYFEDITGRKIPETEIFLHIKESHDSGCTDLSFRGLESYWILFDNNIILPDKTVLRFDDGTVCEVYKSVDKEHAKGIEYPAYNYRQGIHRVEDIVKEFDHMMSFTVSGIWVPEKYVKSSMLWEVYNERNPVRKINKK